MRISVQSSAAVAGRFEEDEADGEDAAVKEINRDWKRAINLVGPNNGVDSTKALKRDNDDGDAIILYEGTMSNAI